MQHHPHHQQGPAPHQHLQHQPHQPHSRPSSIVHQQHQSHSQQHPSAYPQAPQLPAGYHQQTQGSAQQHSQDGLSYYQPSPYSTPGATSGYTSADTSDMMAAAQMSRPYPPMSYHTPQSNSPSSVASPSQHDQHRSIYAQPPSQHLTQSMYHQNPHGYYASGLPPAQQSPYAQHTAPQHQQMPSQQSMMMSQQQQQQQPPQMQPQQSSQHAQQQMTSSPRHMKQEPGVPLQMSKSQSTPLTHSPHPQNGTQMSGSAASTPGGGVNANNNAAAPGPIPATTPLVVRQDGNGVQWIAFEYSRDRVKMEYTIRCDVESVNTDELSADFKTENCVYPRACCPKDQYRGNRQVYETECNTVGWALAQLNPSLRGKRGLIQRAVDSWRNSNQDPRLRSRRVRRQAKLSHRKTGGPNTNPHGTPHMAGPSPPGMPQGPPGAMGPGGPATKMPGMGSMGHMGHAANPGGDEVGDGSYVDEHSHHHHQAPPGQPGSGPDDVRQAQVFNNGGYGGHSAYPAPPSSSIPHVGGGGSHGGPITARRQSRSELDEPEDLFPKMPEAKKRKFILVEDNVRGSRLRVRVTLEGVDTREIPDSFRKGSSVYPRSFFPREMQSPPPSATGSRFFMDDAEDEDDGVDETDGRDARRPSARSNATKMVKVPIGEGTQAEIAIPRMRKVMRGKEVRMNDLGYRMAWLQSRVFAGRTVFLQRALDCYRNKTRSAMESLLQDVKTNAPHYETRVGKRRFAERAERMRSADSDN